MKTFPLRTIRSPCKWLPFMAILIPIFVLILFTQSVSSALWMCGLSLVIMLLAFHFLDRRHKVRIDLTPTDLVVRGDFWGRAWPYENFDISAARFIDFNADPGFFPKWKTCGTAMPGYSSGEFQLRNKSMATVFLSDRSSVLLIPFRSGSYLMLSVGEDFLDALRSPSE